VRRCGYAVARGPLAELRFGIPRGKWFDLVLLRQWNLHPARKLYLGLPRRVGRLRLPGQRDSALGWVDDVRLLRPDSSSQRWLLLHPRAVHAVGRHARLRLSRRAAVCLRRHDPTGPAKHRHLLQPDERRRWGAIALLLQCGLVRIRQRELLLRCRPDRCVVHAKRDAIAVGPAPQALHGEPVQQQRLLLQPRVTGRSRHPALCLRLRERVLKGFAHIDESQERRGRMHSAVSPSSF
jgi:hypothetical protein